MRHSCATHLLERKVGIRVIPALLGYKKLETTSIYAHVATDLLRELIGPLEEMPPSSQAQRRGGPPWRSPTSSALTARPGESPTVAT